MSADLDDVEAKVKRVAEKASEWRGLKFGEKALILRECLAYLSAESEELSFDNISKNIAKVQKLSGNRGEEDSFMGALTFFDYWSSRLNAMILLLDSLETTGKPPQPASTRTDECTGAIVNQVYPVSAFDKSEMIASVGITGEVWMKSEDVTGNRIDTCVAVSQKKPYEIGVTVVLGAGNQEMLAVVDVLDRMILHNEVVILKHHPLRPHMFGQFETLLKPLLTRGYFDHVLDISLEHTRALIYHPLVKHIHLTGGGATHDAIIRGAPGGKLESTFTGELGCVTPWIIVPTAAPSADGEGGSGSNSFWFLGSSAPVDWNEKSVVDQAKHVTFCTKVNGSANCLSPKVVVVAREWEHKKAYLDNIRNAMRDIYGSPPYYPGSLDRFKKFVEQYGDDAEVFTTAPADGIGEGIQYALLHVKLDETNSGGNRYALENEAFANVLAVVELKCLDDGESPSNLTKNFLEKAVKFCNEDLFGSLSCTVISPPAVPSNLLEKAIAGLEYGSVNINAWSPFGHRITSCTWGAYPGKYGGLGKSESGVGVVGNTLMLDESRILKSVVRAPWVHGLVLKGDANPPKLIVEVLVQLMRKQGTGERIWAVSHLLISKLYHSIFGC